MSNFFFAPKLDVQPGPVCKLDEQTFEPDSRSAGPYVYDSAGDLVFAVNTALATGRPLLLFGPSGSGKSCLAPAVARELGWKFLEYVVTTGTQARDLCWKFDALARLADAQTGADKAHDAANYVVPSVLWEAFDPPGAERQRLRRWPEGEQSTRAPGTVVLIDEIDKSEPNVPNDLLIPLGTRRFLVEETGETVDMRGATLDPVRLPMGPLLVIITSNGERRMPEAFLRRCLTHTLQHPSLDRLLTIASAHLALSAADKKIAEQLARLLQASREKMREEGRRAPGTAEYIDAVRASVALSATSAKAVVDRLASTMFEKQTEDTAGG